mgnify:CR=1 FL=1
MRSATITLLPPCPCAPASVRARRSPTAQTPSTPVRQVVIDLDEAALVQLHAAVGGEQILGERTPADRNHDPVDGELLSALGVRRSDLNVRRPRLARP